MHLLLFNLVLQKILMVTTEEFFIFARPSTLYRRLDINLDRYFLCASVITLHVVIY